MHGFTGFYGFTVPKKYSVFNVTLKQKSWTVDQSNEIEVFI